MILIYSIDGNIGSGKSTIVTELKDKFKDNSIINNNDIEFVFADEPIDVWNSIVDKDGETILEKFYKDQEKYSFSFQMMAYISRLSIIKKIMENTKKQNTVIVTERSVFTDYEIFAKMLYNDNKIDEVNYLIYVKWFDEFIKELPFEGIIYVRTDPKLCSDRIKIRNREGENIPLEYLEKCHMYHENWIDKIKNDKVIHLIDGNLDKEISLDLHVNNIINFLITEVAIKINTINL
jgi:deoxyadenosine/deoxycytidine kinase